MDRMSLFSILTASVPEAVCNIYIAFLITGEKTHLYLNDKINVVRLLIAVPLMVVSSVVVRAVVPNMVIVLVANIILTTVIIKFTYNFMWSKALINVLLFVGVLISMEAIFFPVVFQFTNVSLETFLQNDNIRLLFASILRLVHIFFIVSLWNWDRVIFSIKEYKEVKLAFSVFAFILLSIQATFILIFYINMENMPLSVRIIYIVGFSLFSIFNFFLFKFISIMKNAVMKKEINEMIEYKIKTRDRISFIYSSLLNGDIETAKAICKDSYK